MSRHLPGLLALLLLAAAVLPAEACTNDREVNRAERELRSQYLSPAPPAPAPQPSTQERTLPLAVFSGGIVLLCSACALVLTTRRRPAGD